MQSGSSAFKRLVWLYRQLLLRMNAAQLGGLLRFCGRIHIEPLQSRFFMSVTPAGTETLVNTSTTSAMVMPAIAMNPAGNAVVVWTTSASGGQVLGQRYDINGSPVGAQFQIDQASAGGSADPSVAIDDAGDFVVVWSNGSSVFSRVFNSTGVAVVGDTLVTSTMVGASKPVVAMNAAGQFTVAWEGNGAADGDGIYMRNFLANGIATGNSVLVNIPSTGSQTDPAIAIDSAGDAVIAWTDMSTSVAAVQAAYFAASGSSISQFPAGAESSASEGDVSVGIDASGNFVIAWQTHFSGSTGYDITARAFSAAGAPLTSSPVVVNSVQPGDQTNPSVAMRADGSYLIAFASKGQGGGGSEVYAQAFASTGALDGNQFLVNTTSGGNQQDPAAAWSGGNAVIAWDGKGVGDPHGIFLQRYTTSGTTNVAPVNIVPATQSIYENNTLAFSTANSNLISISDSDADGGLEQVALSITHGTVALSSTTGLTFTSGASASAAMTFIGTLASINAALNGMVFTPSSNFIGSGSVQLTSNDLGNSGVSGPKSATSSVSINVQSPPSTTLVPGAQNAIKNTPLVLSAPTDNAIYIGSGWNYIELQATNAKLTLATTSGLSFGSGNGTNNATMEFGGSLAAMNAALNGLIFTPTSGYTGAAQVKLITSNGGFLGLGLFATTATSTIAVTVATPSAAVNITPTIAVPAMQTASEVSPLAVGSITVADSDSAGNPEQLTLTATSGTLTLSSTAGLTFDAGTGGGDVTMTVTGTITSIDAALTGLTFTPTSHFYGSGGIYAAVNDLGNTGTGGAKTTTATVPITITQVNQLPVLSVPAGQTASENSFIAFSSTNSNAIGLSDADANGGQEQLALSTINGTLQLGSTTGLTIAAGGSGQSAVTIVGTLANINSALNALTFVPTAGFVGATSLQLTANDLGNSGPGGSMTATASVPIDVIQSLVVTTASDVTDGNTSSITSLLANPGSDGKISLREAILAINNTPGSFAIDFNIVGGGVKIITVATELPQINNGVVLDGATQPGYTGTPLIELDGLGTSLGTDGILIGASNTTVRGLAICDFSGNGVDVAPVHANNITLQGNYIGITPAGTVALNGTGVILQSSSSDMIGGITALERNVISGNYDQGIVIRGTLSTNDVIEGNYIGTNPNGSAAIPNGGAGVELDGASGSVIGGPLTSERNVISGNTGDGLLLTAISGVGNSIENNLIGTGATGTIALGNGGNGIELDSGGDQIGGIASGVGNVISGNDGYGIEALGAVSSGNLIQGNFIGTDVAGTASLSNTNGGVYLDQTSGTIVGGTAVGGGNVIAGNNNTAADGIFIQGGSTNVVQGNVIGTDVTGAIALGNAHAGINIESSAGNIIGGVTPGAANVIANNSVGVDVWGVAATGNTIRGNSIFANSSIGIDLQNDGVTPNSGALNATLANQGMNFPVITAASLDGGSIALSGYVGSAGGQSAFAGSLIDVYLSDNSLSNGQGKTLLGTLTADSSGNFIGLIAAPAVVNGSILTAEATDSAGDTSEFAANITIQQVNQPPVLTIPGSQSMGENSLLTLSSGGGNAISVADADVAGGQEEAMLSVARGTLTLSSITGITFAGGTSSGTASLDFVGTIGNINSVLDGLVYTPPVDFSGVVSLNVSVDDLGNSGSGGPQITAGSVTINIDAVAQAPFVTAASTLLNTQTTSGLVITPSPTDGSAIGYYQVANITGGTLYLNNGTTTLGNGQFITFAQGLAGLRFTPVNNSTASGSFTVQAASIPGIGGLVATAVTATIGVNGPAISAPGTQTLAQDSTLVFTTGSGNTISVSDAGVGSGVLTVDLSSANGILTLGSLSGITIGGGGNGQSNIDFTGTVADINAALAGLSIAYANHFAGASNLAIVAIDSSNSATAVVPINVTAVAHTPSITPAAANENQLTSSGLVITPSAIDATQTIYYQISNITGGDLFESDGVTQINNGNVISVAQGLAGLKFLPALDSSSSGGFDVQASLTASTAGLDGDVVHAAIVVIVPDAPVNTVPSIESGSENMPVVFSAAAVNAISVSNPDNGPQRVTLTASHGTLSLATLSGLTLISGTGSGDSNVTFTGLSGDINTALDGLTFTPTSQFTGVAQIQITTTDAQSMAANNPLSVTSDVDVSVAAPSPVAPPITPPVTPVVPTPPPVPPVKPIQHPVTQTPTQTPTPAPSSQTINSPEPATMISQIQDPTSPAPVTAVSAEVPTTTSPVQSSSVIVAAAGEGGGPQASLAQQVNTPAPAAAAKTNAPAPPAQPNPTPPQPPATPATPPQQPAVAKTQLAAAATFSASSPIWHDLDVMQQKADTDHETRVHIIAGTATLVSTGMSVMYFIWAIRAGSILSSFLSSMPAWKLVDPLPILDQAAIADDDAEEEDEESLQSMVDQPRKKAA